MVSMFSYPRTNIAHHIGEIMDFEVHSRTCKWKSMHFERRVLNYKRKLGWILRYTQEYIGENQCTLKEKL